MTDDNAPPTTGRAPASARPPGEPPQVIVPGGPPPGALRIAGRPLVERFLAAVPAMTRAVVTELVDEVPVYGLLPREELDGDIPRIVERTLRTFGEVLRSRGVPSAETLAGIRESAARRAEEGVPIDAVLTAYHLGARICLDHVAGDAGPADVGDLLATQRLLLEFLQRVTSAVAAGYVADRRTDDHAARQALLAALLDGLLVEPAAARAGVRLPASYLVLSLHFAPHPDEEPDPRATGSRPPPATVGPVAARRKVRRVRVELDHQSAEPVLSMLTADGGVALLPCAKPPEALTGTDWARFAELAARLGRAAGTEVLAGAVAADPRQVADAAVLAREILGVARTFGRRSGLFQLADLLVEYQLTRPSAARDQLAGLLGPLDAELLATLRAYVESGLSRQRAARHLHVHPNTVDYRLRKVAALTGLDASQPGELPRIAAALAARDAADGR
ncbi:helix-turn-helix domain-containing protein [Longispora sp. NPDC051575]|uniref:PucR family transcriptional regulator n=1 Tax=Longispora sp. NPDC051575 TaxID=3154943 RepID=UPI00341B6CE3